jgi:hypothetical protein
MTARDLAPELQREAALARFRNAKESWARAAVAFLHGHDDAQEQVNIAFKELADARAALAAIDQAANEDED